MCPCLPPPNPLLAHRVLCVRTTTRAEKKILQCGVFHLERDCKRFVSCLAIKLAKGNGLLWKGWSGSTGPLKAAPGKFSAVFQDCGQELESPRVG